MYFENKGEKLVGKPLGMLAQVSSINSILSQDYNKDGYLDILVAGNLYGSEIETPRNDASYGLYLKGGKNGQLLAVPSMESGLVVDGEVKHIGLLKGMNGEDRIIFVRNNDTLRFYSFNCEP